MCAVIEKEKNVVPSVRTLPLELGLRLVVNLQYNIISSNRQLFPREMQSSKRFETASSRVYQHVHRGAPRGTRIVLRGLAPSSTSCPGCTGPGQNHHAPGPAMCGTGFPAILLGVRPCIPLATRGRCGDIFNCPNLFSAHRVCVSVYVFTICTSYGVPVHPEYL